MAALRRVPAPKPKEVDWGEEFRKERSRSKSVDIPRSPVLPNLAAAEPRNETQLPEPVREFNVQQSAPSDTATVGASAQSFGSQQQASIKENDNSSYRDQNNNYPSNTFGSNFNQYMPSQQQQSPQSQQQPQQYHQQQQQPEPQHQQQQVQQPTQQKQQQQRVFSPFATSPQPNLPKPMSPIKLNQSNQDENLPIYMRSSQQRAASEKPASPQIYPQSPTAPNYQRQISLEQGSTPIYTRSPRNVAASPVKQFNQTFQPNTNDTENYPIYVRSFQRQQPPSPAPPPPASSSAAPIRTQQQQNQQQQQPISTNQSSFVNEPGRQYYNPNSAATSTASAPGSSAQNSTQMPPWMRRSNSKEIPEWANNANDYNRSAPANSSSTFGNDYNRTAPSYANNTSTFGNNTSNYPTTTANQYNDANSTTKPQYNNTTNFNGGAPMVCVHFFECFSPSRFHINSIFRNLVFPGT